MTLTADAVARLGISTEVVQREEVAQHRTFAGEAMIPSGRSIIVSAPVPGVLSATAEGGFPLPGARVDVTQTVLVLRPLLSPERDVPTPAEQVQMTGARANLIAALVTAEGEVQRSQSEVDGLVIALNRAEKLYADRAGSRRAVDDAEAQLNIANSMRTAARERAQQLADLVESLKSDNPEAPPSPLLLKAPVKGIVRSVSVSAGQTVTAGAPLFEVVNLDKIWVRVPVYVDLLGTLAWTEPARLVALDGGPLEPPAANREATSTNPGPPGPPQAMPIAAPPTADAASSSADLYYEVDNRVLGLRPGQRLGVAVKLEGSEQAVVIPSAAILYDIYGGTWVYVMKPQQGDSGKAVFQRQRVMLEWVEGDRAILSSGPGEAAAIVVDGAAELFGTEFGAGK